MVTPNLVHEVASSPASAGYTPRRRLTAVLPILAVHAGVLALVASERGAAVAVPRAMPSLVVFNVPPSPLPAAVAKPSMPVQTLIVQPPRIVDPPIAAPMAAMPEVVAEANDTAPLAGGCDLTDTVQAALRDNVDVRSALAALPSSARSVANAVMLWDGRWIDGNSLATRRALVPVRDVVLATIDGATPECRAQLQAGPRLIAIAGPPDTMLALGSGRWRWGDLGLSTDMHPPGRSKRS